MAGLRGGGLFGRQLLEILMGRGPGQLHGLGHLCQQLGSQGRLERRLLGIAHLGAGRRAGLLFQILQDLGQLGHLLLHRRGQRGIGGGGSLEHLHQSLHRLQLLLGAHGLVGGHLLEGAHAGLGLLEGIGGILQSLHCLGRLVFQRFLRIIQLVQGLHRIIALRTFEDRVHPVLQGGCILFIQQIGLSQALDLFLQRIDLGADFHLLLDERLFGIQGNQGAASQKKGAQARQAVSAAAIIRRPRQALGRWQFPTPKRQTIGSRGQQTAAAIDPVEQCHHRRRSRATPLRHDQRHQQSHPQGGQQNNPETDRHETHRQRIGKTPRPHHGSGRKQPNHQDPERIKPP